MRVTGAHGDGSGLQVAVIDVPAIRTLGRAVAGKEGNGGIQAQAGA